LRYFGEKIMTDILKKLEMGRKRKQAFNIFRKAALICIVCALLIGGGAFFVIAHSGITQTESSQIFYTELSETMAEIPTTQEYEVEILCGKHAEVRIAFPGGSELIITGADVDIQYVRRQTSSVVLAHASEHGFTINAERLSALVAEFTGAFNQKLDDEAVHIYDESIAIIKGARQVIVCENAVFELAYEGLLKSLSTGEPEVKIFKLPYVQTDISELEKLRYEILIYAVSAEFDPETGEISDCIVGIDFDIDTAIKILDETQSGEIAIIELIFTQPETSREFLEATLFRDMIGETITYIAGTANRLNNIILSSDAVDGHILMPGEEFSFNQTVGRRTYERGYRAAPAFMGGQTVNVIGGGICQVSSSIFNAIMDSDIRIVERRPHGRPVAYLPVGRDATVSWGTIDFRFENNTDFPLRIDSQVNDRELIVRVFGTIIEMDY